MEKQEIQEVVSAVKALIKYKDNTNIYDEEADDGDGRIDLWMSSELSNLFDKLEDALEKLDEKESTLTFL